MQIFGAAEAGFEYRERHGAYCVLFDRDRIAVVNVLGRLLLPGGGIESGEDAEMALAREFKEETGLLPINPRYIFQTGEYMISLDGISREFVVAHLYCASESAVNGPSTEADHELIWLDYAQAVEELLRPGQRWAVSEARSHL